MQEGMPMIDDPVSMIRCSNKVYLDELMQANNVKAFPEYHIMMRLPLPQYPERGRYAPAVPLSAAAIKGHGTRRILNR